MASTQEQPRTAAGKRGSADQAVLAALSANPRATAAEIATTAGLGRSTAGKLLAELERTGKARRTPGGRNGARRLPDRWEPASTAQAGAAQPASGPVAGQSEEAPPAAATEPREPASGRDQATAKQPADRLPAGALDGLVLGFMREQAEQPVGPVQIGKAIGKSSGAVANCLVRLAREGKVRQVGERPVRYGLNG